MRRNLPPLNASKAFETAARHLSFKAAAEELLVTPQAVSHQIKVLEDWFQTALFIRRNRSIVLTATGTAFLPVVRQALDSLEASATALARVRSPNILTINAPPTFAIRWLIPRLDRFRMALSDLDYRLTTSVELPDLLSGSIDVAIHWRQVRDISGLQSELLMALDLVPVCSPELIGKRKISSPAELLDFPLIRHTFDPGLWDIWAQSVVGDDILAPEGLRFDSDLYMIEAEVEGQGICLITREEVVRDLQSGRLVIPFDKVLPRAGQVHLVYPRARQADREIMAFRDWILDEIAGFRRDAADRAG
ncbi:MAG: LysR substrate-binding domain-containing protein [Alphaproteobacteria bacterium]|nr:LysR substrate-binding domain-containing protein [Alphaproteobacteria bacterium]